MPPICRKSQQQGMRHAYRSQSHTTAAFKPALVAVSGRCSEKAPQRSPPCRAQLFADRMLGSRLVVNEASTLPKEAPCRPPAAGNGV